MKINESGRFGFVEERVNDDFELIARKTFRPKDSYSTEELSKLRKRFVREVQVQEAVAGEGIALEVKKSELEGDSPWFEMPWANETFSSVARAKFVIGEEDAIKHLCQLLDVLEALHSLGFAHRDLKPSNILWHDNRWKLADFGLVTPPSTATSRLTKGSTWGTENYCAPEQHSQFSEADSLSDIYSFGCICFEVLGGKSRIPYAQCELEGKFELFLKKCTEVDPKNRYQSVAEVRNSLLFAMSSESTAKASNNDIEIWGERIRANLPLTKEHFHEFVDLLAGGSPTVEDEWILFGQLPLHFFIVWIAESKRYANRLAKLYCAWACKSSFQFAFCDVVGTHIWDIYNSGDTASKAEAFVAAVDVAYHHRRWNVMRVALSMCGPDVNKSIVTRLCMEIRMGKLESKLVAFIHSVQWAELHPDVHLVLYPPR